MIKLLKSTLRIIKTLVLVCFLGCLIVFMINNRQPIVISLYPLPFELETKVFLVMISLFLLGLFFGTISFSKSWLLGKIEQFKHKRTIAKLSKKLDQHNLESTKK